MGDLAARQAALLAALVSGGPPPPGFDRERLAAASAALLRKRARAVARQWPLLAAGCGTRWPSVFTDWAVGRTPAGALRDGWDFARHLHATGNLTDLACAELACREAVMRYDGHRPPRRRWLPTLRRIGNAVVFGFAGRPYVLRTASRRPA